MRLSGHRGKSQGSVHELEDSDEFQRNRWASLPTELLCDVIKRLEASESTWPARKNVVVCASVCKAWREMCLEIVQSPETSGKLTFPISLKQVCCLVIHTFYPASVQMIGKSYYCGSQFIVLFLLSCSRALEME